jgi:autotransporter-associated beta strand protein
MTSKISSACLWAASAMLVCGSLSGEASAAVFTWAGNNANWGTNSSWLNNAQPANGDSVLFTNAGTGTSSAVNIARTITDITFGASANRTFSVSGNGQTTLGSIANDSGFAQILNNRIALSSTSGLINTGSSGLTLGGVLLGSGNYSKTGSGVLQITSANSGAYTGTLSVDAGSVRLATGLDSGNIVVNSGATLYTANDFVNGSAASITVNSGATLTPGENAVTRNAGDIGYGAFTVVNDTTLNAGSIVNLGVGSVIDFDQVNSGGVTTFGGALTIGMDYTPDLFGTTAPYFLDGDSWALFSSGSFTGDFTSINMTGVYGNVSFTKIDNDVWQSEYLGNGQQFNFYVNSANGGVAGTLYAVPEPSTIVFAGIGIAMFGWSTWTRRRAKNRRQAIEAAIA